MKKNLVKLTALLLALLLTGCAAKNSYSTDTGYTAAAYAMEDAMYDSAPVVMNSMAASDSAARKSAGSETASLGNDGTKMPEGRKWIINMYVSAECSNLDEALAAVSRQISAMGGYIESQSINNGSSTYRQRRSASMTIRVPADQADAFMQQVGGLTNVTSSSRTVTDITLAYTDTAGRITALETEEARLLELMAKAEDMSDLLAIESRLTDVRYELESYASTLRLYDNQIDYATIDLSLTQVTVYTPVEEPSFGKRIADGLKDTFEDLADFAVDFIAAVIIDLPYILIWALVGWAGFVLIRRRIRKWKAKRAEKKAQQS